MGPKRPVRKWLVRKLLMLKCMLRKRDIPLLMAATLIKDGYLCLIGYFQWLTSNLLHFCYNTLENNGTHINAHHCQTLYSNSLQKLGVHLCLLPHKRLIDWVCFQIKLVNINPTDIANGKPAIVLGLVWTIILYFQVILAYLFVFVFFWHFRSIWWVTVLVAE